MPPFESLDFLYVGCADFDRDVAHFRRVLAADPLWAFARFGARVAAFRLAESGPLWLVADHRPAPSCFPVYRVGNLADTLRILGQRGWQPDGEPFDIPNGPCRRLIDPSGNLIAIYQNDRPDQMRHAYADPLNVHAIRF